MNEDTNKPMHARIATIGQDKTVVSLDILGKVINIAFKTRHHREQAIHYTNNWNNHLDREWELLGKTNATIMERFVHYLKAYGVSEAIINAATDKVKKDAEG